MSRESWDYVIHESQKMRTSGMQLNAHTKGGFHTLSIMG